MTNPEFCLIFKNNKILTLKQLLTQTKVTPRTINNYLRRVGALTSYNKRGMYYTLPSTPSFNENAVWEKDGICFSEQGTLKKTFIHLITSSNKGMNSSEISEALLMPADQVINIYRNLNEVKRKK
jgi:hypothetical protein